MSRSFEMKLPGDAEMAVEAARKAAHAAGAELWGDRFAGRFLIAGIEGNYRVAGSCAVVTLEQKPEFSSWESAQETVRGLFGSSTSAAADTGTRRTRGDAIIKKHVIWSTGAGLLPIPLADLAAVTAVQISMLEDLSTLYGGSTDQKTIKHFATALTGTMAARVGASVVKAIPGLGSLVGGLSMSVLSGASTYAVGQVARNQLELSGDLTSTDMTRARHQYQQEFESGKQYVSRLKDEGNSGDDLVGRLERLAALRDKGILTEEEFAAQKDKLLTGDGR
jgi:uncharacterized protein (DUF697 family)